MSTTDRRDPRAQMMIELAHAMAALAVDDYDQVLGIITAVHTRLVKRNAQATLPGMPAPEPEVGRDEARQAAVRRLFAYWQERCEHSAAKLTPERARCIMARLRDGYTEAEVRKAIDGASVAAFVNDDGHKYDDLTLICRNGSKLESFITRGVKATGDIAVSVGDSSPVEDQITQLRRDMATYRKDGRTTEYTHAEAELLKLMAKRKAVT